MIHKVLIFSILPCIVLCNVNETSSSPFNTTAPHQEMYVIHATHYEVGILANSSDPSNTTNSGVQEAVMIFKSNGSSLSLGNITAPVFTNITKDTVLGVAPVALTKDQISTQPWPLQMAPVSNGSEANPLNGLASAENTHEKAPSDVHKLSTMEKEKQKPAEANSQINPYLMPALAVFNNITDKLVPRPNSISNN